MTNTLKEFLKDYCTNCTFAGLHYIAEPARHWTERLFWIACVLLSWYGSALLISASWDAFRTSPVSFVVESNYIDWNTPLPAIGFCENDNLERIYAVSDEIWTPSHAIDLEEVLKEIAYFRGISYYTLQFCNKPNSDPKCPKDNFGYYADLVRSNCQQSVSNCSYNDQPFECCQYFDEVITEIGKCYLINSAQSKNGKTKRYPMVSNKSQPYGNFKMEMLIPARVFTLSEEDVPAITTLQSDFFHVVDGISYKRHIAIRDIENDALIRETTPQQRHCRFGDEDEAAGGARGLGPLYRRYSFSGCTMRCRRDAQLSMCNCTNHFMPATPEEYRCDIAGMACLNTFYSDLSVMRPAWARRRGLVCECLQACDEQEITVIKDEKKGNFKKTSSVEILLEHIPTERFKRNVIRSRLDLVVSIGGTTGLFVGASLLSFVELIFYFTVRYYNDTHDTFRNNHQTIRNGNRTKPDLPELTLDPTVKIVDNVAIVEVKRYGEDFRQHIDHIHKNMLIRR